MPLNATNCWNCKLGRCLEIWQDKRPCGSSTCRSVRRISHTRDICRVFPQCGCAGASSESWTSWTVSCTPSTCTVSLHCETWRGSSGAPAGRTPCRTRSTCEAWCPCVSRRDARGALAGWSACHRRCTRTVGPRSDSGHAASVRWCSCKSCRTHRTGMPSHSLPRPPGYNRRKT